MAGAAPCRAAPEHPDRRDLCLGDALPGLEPARTFRRRVIQAIEAVLAHHPSGRVVVITHASVINAYLSMLLEVPRDMFFLPEHGSITTVRALGDLYAVRSVNDHSHLVSPVDAVLAR
ncbi:MAG: histidine phosphatase family protein [Dehalococcoidia bacterium]